MTPDPDTVALLRETIPTLCAPFVDPDAVPGTPAWFTAVAAANLRDAAQLLGESLEDTYRHPP